jgi:hypothetical protein
VTRWTDAPTRPAAVMTTLSTRASGPRPAEDAWERYARPALWSSWSPQIRRVATDAERLHAGATGRVYGPVGVSIDFVVDEWDEAARRWSWTAHRGPVRLRLEHGVDADGPGSSTFLRVHGPLPVVFGYLPVARFALHRLVH